MVYRITHIIHNKELSLVYFLSNIFCMTCCGVLYCSLAIVPVIIIIHLAFFVGGGVFKQVILNSKIERRIFKKNVITRSLCVYFSFHGN